MTLEFSIESAIAGFQIFTAYNVSKVISGFNSLKSLAPDEGKTQAEFLRGMLNLSLTQPKIDSVIVSDRILGNIVRHALIALAYAYPLNETELIDPAYRVAISSGHQFDLKKLLDNTQGSNLVYTHVEMKHTIKNPYTNKVFNDYDLLYLYTIGWEKGLFDTNIVNQKTVLHPFELELDYCVYKGRALACLRQHHPKLNLNSSIETILSTVSIFDFHFAQILGISDLIERGVLKAEFLFSEERNNMIKETKFYNVLLIKESIAHKELKFISSGLLSVFAYLPLIQQLIKGENNLEKCLFSLDPIYQDLEGLKVLSRKESEAVVKFLQNTTPPFESILELTPAHINLLQSKAVRSFLREYEIPLKKFIEFRTQYHHESNFIRGMKLLVIYYQFCCFSFDLNKVGDYLKVSNGIEESLRQKEIASQKIQALMQNWNRSDEAGGRSKFSSSIESVAESLEDIGKEFQKAAKSLKQFLREAGSLAKNSEAKEIDSFINMALWVNRMQKVFPWLNEEIGCLLYQYPVLAVLFTEQLKKHNPVKTSEEDKVLQEVQSLPFEIRNNIASFFFSLPRVLGSRSLPNGLTGSLQKNERSVAMMTSIIR